MARSEEETLAAIAKSHQELSVKKTFPGACQKLASLCDPEGEELPEKVSKALADAGKRAFSVLQSRFSNPKFWQAGLELFLNLEFHVPAATDASRWREAAMAEVDEDAREAAQALKEKQKKDEEARRNRVPSQREMLAAMGIDLADLAAEDARPAMHRDARNELRLVTVTADDVCVVCQETLPALSKAKQMPCGHFFHDECLVAWVEKNNSCPTCRFDALPSEKKAFDLEEREIARKGPHGGIFT